MRKAEIARRIAEATGLTQVKADDVVDAILDEIKVALQRGDAVTLRRFGSFAVRDKGARLGRNPKTGQSAAIVARRSRGAVSSRESVQGGPAGAFERVCAAAHICSNAPAGPRRRCEALLLSGLRPSSKCYPDTAPGQQSWHTPADEEVRARTGRCLMPETTR
jgi:nucleoid DNA-binding protein